MKIALIGYGAMGRLVERLAAERGYSIVAIIRKNESDSTPLQIAEELAGCDAVIDFSEPAAVRRNTEACILADVPLVEGTTGWNTDRADIERIVTRGEGAFIYGANFSIGVNLFYRITEFAAELFSKFPDYEVFLEEQHHARKRDAPSGTALKLTEIVASQIPGKISVSATRAGYIPGTHRIGFDGTADQVLLEHTARNREGFASGALMAAEWIVGKKGFFEFGEVIEEICHYRKD